MKKVLVCLVVALFAVVAGSAEALEFPAQGKMGLYHSDIGYSLMLYRDPSTNLVRGAAWFNGSGCEREPAIGVCVGYRLRGEFLADGSLLLNAHLRGNTLVPDQTSLLNTFRIFTDGVVTSSDGGQFFIDNHRYPDRGAFFGIRPDDVPTFTSQWGYVSNGDGTFSMRLLTREVSPFFLDWDVEGFPITDRDGDTYYILLAIGEGRTALEFSAVHTGSDGIRRPLDEPCAPWIFNDTAGCVVVHRVLPYADAWWLGEGGPDVRWINGRGVISPTADLRVLDEYKLRGPVCYDPTISGCFPE